MAEKKKVKAKKKTTTKKKTTKKVVAKVKKEETVVKKAPAPAAKVEAAVAVSAPKPRKKKVKVPKTEKYYGTGRRKEAVAKVWLVPGSGNISVNGKDYSQYFCKRKLLEFQVLRPLVVSNVRNNYDVIAEAFGGGVPGQAGAVSLGIARALLVVSPDFRGKLKKEGLLRRDPRMKERKKYGRKRARKSFQYTKR
jgi:small subunit ribosomal protein S9